MSSRSRNAFLMGIVALLIAPSVTFGAFPQPFEGPGGPVVILPADWVTTDEFYNMQPYPTNVKYLIRLDELTLAQRHGTHPGHGDFSPRAWCQNYDGGHVWVTPIGHDNNFYRDATTGNGLPTTPFPGQAEFKRLVVQGIKMTMGVTAAMGGGTANSTTFCPK